MIYKKWTIPEVDKQLAMSLSEECDIDPMIALISSLRGYTDPYELEQFLEKDPHLRNPYELKGMHQAVQRINQALDKKEKIAVYGDYDCDGVTATAIVYDCLKKKNADIKYVIPQREEDGYGLNQDQIQRLKNEDVTLIITVDNGINCSKEIEYANQLGVDVIVTDHHLPQDEIPKAVAVIDPYLQNGEGIFYGLSGCGVAFKLVCAIERKMPEEILYKYADLVAIGTVADIMPMSDENRSFVREGLKKINSDDRIGIKALREISGLDKKQVDVSVISFGISPRINAAGRMGNAVRALELLTCNNYDEAILIAQELDEENKTRQLIEKQTLAEACEIIEKNGYQNNRIIVVEKQGWHNGILGIVASRITQKYGKPSIIISTNQEESRGSGRSIEGFSLFDAISSVKDLLQKFGGHELAAGITIDSNNIDTFRKRVNEYAAKTKMVFPSVNLDCKLNLVAISLDLAAVLEDLEPYGQGNPVPLFGLLGVKIEKIIPLNMGRHLKLQLSKGNTVIMAIMFGKTFDDFEFEIGQTVDVAININVNTFNGSKNVATIIKEIRISGINTALTEEQIELYNDFNSGFNLQKKFYKIKPKRNEMVLIYKYITQFTHGINIDKLINNFINEMPIGKILVSIDVLCELGVLNKKGKLLKKSVVEGKADLTNSFILKKLSET